MTPEEARWRRVQDLCVAALECDATDRDALLTSACAGDGDLRQEIESLLAHDAAADRFLAASTLERWAHAVVPRSSVSHVGHAFGPYEIQALIGAGGMGEVYRARDRRLHRDVAVKVLSSAFSGDPDRLRRFEREARAAAALNHPNILAVYDIGTQDGEPYIVSEFLAGETLAERLTRGPLSLLEAVDVAIQLGHALAAAHAIGVVHRDLKPANIFLTPRLQVKVLDFGLAKMRDAASPITTGPGAPLDESGTTPGIGTLAYMAPEQLTGARADPRLDVWSLGVVLYEMVTGRRPFRGTGREAVAVAIASATPDPLRTLRPGIPPDLDRVLNRALAKNAEDRPHAEELLTDLQGVRLALSQSAGRSRAYQRSTIFLLVIAAAILVVGLADYLASHWTGRGTVPFGARDWVLVTRFDNRTGEKQFDGILEHVLTYNLSQSSYVNVVPPERVDDDLRLMGKPPTTIVDAAAGPAVALRDAGIRLVVDGEIDRLRAGYAVTVRVVDPHGDTTIARDREEASTTADVSSAMRRVSTWIELTLGETPATVKLENEQAEPVTTRSLVALGDYAEALHAFNIGRFPQADALFGSALSEDPSFPSALIWKAWAEENLGRPRQVYIQSARRAVDLVARATESERYWILGSYYELTDQRQLAIAQYEALTRRFPDNTWALQNLVGLYRVTGRSQDAVDMLVRSANSRAGDFTAQVVAAQAVLTTNGLDAARPSIARAQMLVSSVSDTFKGGSGSAASPFRSWVLAFPAYDLWAQGRGKDAAAALDAASRRSEFDAEGLWALNLLGASRLALGQVRLAEAAFARLTGGQREIAMAELALARNDVPAIIGLLKSYGGYDPVAVSLLVRAGDVRAADQVLRMNRSIHFANETRAGWAADEIAEARGDNRRIMAELENGLPWVRDLHGGARAFLYSETLARAAAVAGNIAGAIRVLEETGASGETAYTPATNNGYYWMRTQKLLADLYREEGQVDKARVVERDLLARLAVADPDYPMLIELKQRAGK